MFVRSSNAEGQGWPVWSRSLPCLGPPTGGQGFQHGGIRVFFPSITLGQRFHGQTVLVRTGGLAFAVKGLA